MAQGIDGFIAAINVAKTPHHVWSAMETYCQYLGFDSLAFILATHGEIGEETGEKPQDVLIYERSNLVGRFDKEYQTSGAVAFDPFLIWGCRSFAPLNFGAVYAGQLPDMSRQQQEFLDLAANSGVQQAMGVPVSLRDESEYGGWIIGVDSENTEQFHTLLAEQGECVRLASVIAFERMTGLCCDRQDETKALSPRECECLTWLCSGLRTGQIADKLGLSVSAVRLYIANARKKLGAKTREHAIALAVLHGQVSL